jgi:hypothetical protein
MPPFTVNRKTYKSKAAAQACAKEILNTARLYRDLPITEKNFMISWFEQVHENTALKFGCGVKSISVRRTPYGTRGFWITRTDGTETDISYLPTVTKYSKVNAALRTAIRPSIEKWLTENHRAIDEHVDHAGDWPFSRIVTEFERRIGRKRETFKLKPHSDGDMQQELADANLAVRFRAFHDEVATLEALDAQENIKKSDKGASKPKNERDILDWFLAKDWYKATP